MKVQSVLLLGAVGLMKGILLGQTPSLREQNEALFQQLRDVHGLSDAQMTAMRGIFAKSGYMGQGNPNITVHPVTPEQAQAKLTRLGIKYANPNFEKICGGKY